MAKLDVNKVTITNFGDKLVLPADPRKMTEEEAITVLQRKIEYDNETISVRELIQGFPYDGALALMRSIEEIRGFVFQEATPTMFGSNPPQVISIPDGVDHMINIPWGRFSIPGVAGWIQTGTATKDGRTCLEVQAKILRKDEPVIRQIIALARMKTLEESIYRNKAIEVSFQEFDDERDTWVDRDIPEVDFLKPHDAQPIFRTEIEDAIRQNILVPIKFHKDLAKLGISLKRGVLLAGPYGTGKTLTANMVRKVAIESGYTFVYVNRIEELTKAIEFCRFYPPAVLFGEDLDRIAGAYRSEDVNDLLNTLDGIGGKEDKIFVILTTNHPEKINEAMRRPGRIDQTIFVAPPDAMAVCRLIRLFAGDLLEAVCDLTEVAQLLAGYNPAVVKEVVTNAKLAAIDRTGTVKDLKLTSADMLSTAKQFLLQSEYYKQAPPARTEMEQVADSIAMVATAIKTQDGFNLEALLAMPSNQES